ncbi:MAG TPA: hypothetical protein PK765_00715 [bacterium]|nr:hypothetical protein [bacterium]
MNRLLAGCVAVIVSTVSVVSVYAATNKETVIAGIDSLVSEIRTTRTARADALLTAATTLSNEYEKAMTASGVSADDVDTLFAAGKITGTPFRQSVSSQYRSLVDSLFSDIDNVSASLLASRTDIVLGYSDLTDGQKKTFESEIAASRNQYATFVSGSQSAIDAFLSANRATLKTEVARLVTIAAEERDTLAVLRDIRSRYATLESGLDTMKSDMDYIRTNILDALQNNITFLAEEKAKYLVRMQANFDAGIEKAIAYERVRARKGDIEVYRDVLLQRWQSYADTNFADDQMLLLSYLKAQNIVDSEKALRQTIYTDSGIIRYAEVLADADGLFSRIQKLQSDIVSTNADLANLKTRYAGGASSIATDLKTDLANAYSEKLVEYQDEFQDYIETVAADQTNLEQLVSSENQANELEKQQNASYIRIMELEKSVIDTTIAGSHSVEFARDTIAAFESRIKTLAAKGDSRVKRRADQLIHDARYQLVNRILLQDEYTPYTKSRSVIVTAVSERIAGIEQQKGVDATLEYLKKVDSKIEIALASGLSVKNTHLLLSVRRALYDYIRTH